MRSMRRSSRSPSFFDGRPVVLDLGALPSETPDVAGLLRSAERRAASASSAPRAQHPSWQGLEAWAPLHANGDAPGARRSTCQRSRAPPRRQRRTPIRC